jgi:hypothetical protein
VFRSEVSKRCSRRTRAETHPAHPQCQASRDRPPTGCLSAGELLHRPRPGVSAGRSTTQPAPWQRCRAGECVGGAASSLSTRTTWFSATTAGTTPQIGQAAPDQHHLHRGNSPARWRWSPDAVHHRSTTSMTRCPGRSHGSLAAPLAGAFDHGSWSFDGLWLNTIPAQGHEPHHEQSSMRTTCEDRFSAERRYAVHRPHAPGRQRTTRPGRGRSRQSVRAGSSARAVASPPACAEVAACLGIRSGCVDPRAFS